WERRSRPNNPNYTMMNKKLKLWQVITTMGETLLIWAKTGKEAEARVQSYLKTYPEYGHAGCAFPVAHVTRLHCASPPGPRANFQPRKEKSHEKRRNSRR